MNLSVKYGKTQNQILLNWIVSKEYLPLTKSETILHIDEHLEAIKFRMEQSDIDLLDKYIIPNYTTPLIDWNGSGTGYVIDQLSNVFDQIYDDQIH